MIAVFPRTGIKSIEGRVECLGIVPVFWKDEESVGTSDELKILSLG